MKKLFLFLTGAFLFFIQYVNAQTNVSANITSNTTWTLANSPYILTSSINVSSGVTLTIEAGVSVKFNSGKSLQIDGTLIARGTQQNNIIFTSNSTSPASGDWSNISFTANSVSASLDNNGNYLSGTVLEYCIIEYGGANSSDVLKINGSGTLISPLISKCNIRKNKAAGIYISYSASTISNCIIELCSTGVSIQGQGYNGSPIITDNLIKNNTSAGIEGGETMNTVIIKRNVIKGNGLGINCRVYGVQYIIQSNIIVGNRDYGVFISTVTGSLDISKNIIAENLGPAISFDHGFGLNPTITSNQFIGNAIASNNTIYQNFGLDANQARLGGGVFKKNLFSRNFSKGNVIFIEGSQATTFDSSNYFSNRSPIYLNNNNLSGTTINASNNFWNSITDSIIQARIYDFNDDATKSLVAYSPYLNSPYIKVPISPPTNVKKATSATSIFLSWSANPESDRSGYKIYYGGYTGYSFTNVIDVGNVTSYTLPVGVNLTDDIAVTAYDLDKDGVDDQLDGNESWYSLANVAPFALANINSYAGAHKVKLTWDVSSSAGVNNYNIYRSTDGTNFNKITSVVSNSYTDANLTAYAKYYYKVTAFDSLDASYDNYGLESLQSAAVNATPNNLIYVDATTGSDVTGLGSIEKPFAKISTGTSAAISGDSILIGNGTYSDNIQFQDKSLFIIGSNGANNVLIKSLQSTQILNITNAGNTFIKWLTFANLPSGSPGAAILSTRSNPIIESCIFRDNGGLLGVIYNDAGSLTLNNCIGYNNSSNYFFNAGTTITSPLQINHFTYTGNTGSLLNTNSNIVDTVARIKNSIIWSNTNVTYTGKVAILNSVIKGGYSGNSTNINSNPRFVDSLNKDYHLLNYSPAIGLGLNNTGVATDFENNSRSLPIGSNPDAGAYESNFGQSSPLIDSTKSLDGFLVFNWTQVPSTNIDSFTVYKDTVALPVIKYGMVVNSIVKLTDSANVIFNTPVYYRMQSRSQAGLSSGYSNIIKSIIYTAPKLLLPSDKTIKADTSIRFSWNKVANATRYRIQVAVDSGFVSILTTQTIADSFLTVSALGTNKYYYWRVRSEDSIRTSKWSNFNTFQTKVPVPAITSISTSDKRIQLVFSIPAIQNIIKINIYRDTTNLPVILKDTTAITKLSYTDSVANQIKYNYRLTAVNAQGVESNFSNILSAVALYSPQLSVPVNNLVKSVLSPVFSWTSVPFATKYQRQVDTSVQFNSLLKRNDTLSTINQTLPLPLLANTTYYWQVKSGDNTGWSNWSNIFKFQTIITPPLLVSISPANKRDTLKWNKVTTGTVSFYKIYRDTISTPTTLLDSVTGDKLMYLDTSSLSLNVKYYYSIKSVNKEGVESNMSNILSGTPFNAPPVTVALKSKTFDNTGEFNTVRLVYSAAGSADSDGTITGYKWYVNDSLVNQTDSILIYYFNQGLNDLKLVVTDNDGSTASSSAQIKMSAFVKKFKGGILGGITALNENTLYTADSTFDAANGASVYKIDRTGNTIFPLIVSSKIFTTPSVSSDSSVFITSGSSLNGFNSSGAPLWSTIPLGGLSFVTPTIDSIQSRLYVGVSNSNFFAIDYNTGKVVWNVLCDAPINSSAIITGDRKLVFASDNGTLYGFDLKTITGQPTPTWKLTIPGKIIKSPAVDSSNNLYFGTVSGNLIKLKLESNGTVTTLWSAVLGSSVKTSPVIDAKGFVYIGTEAGQFYKLNPANGNTIWSYSSKGAIRSTPTISGYGNIYLADISGYITSLSENGIVNWKYQDSSAISSNLLTINNMTYVGTEGGRLIGFYDNPTTNTVNTSLSYNFQKIYRADNNGSMASVNQFSKIKLIANSLLDAVFLPPPATLDLSTPVWGTFQGNFRRTGSRSFECPSAPIINIPNCKETSDSIRISTGSMTNKYWVINDSILKGITDTSIYIKTTDKYKLLAYNFNGCNVYSTGTVLIPNSNIDKPSLIPNNGSNKFCDGDSIILTSSLEARKYQWNFSGSAINGARLKSLTAILSGSYNLTVTNSFGCNATSDLSMITSIPSPSAPNVSSISYCQGAIANALSANASSGNSILWYGTSATGGSSSTTAPIPLTTNEGINNYYVSQKNSSGCESPRAKLTITVNPLPTVSVIAAGGSTTFCTGGSVTLTSSSATGNQWYKDGILISNATGSTFTAKEMGLYTDTIVNTSGCKIGSGATSVTIITQSSPVKAVVSGLATDTTLCFRDSIVLKSSNYYDRYIWSNGDTLQTITVKKSDNINLKGASTGSPCVSLPSASLVLIKNINIVPLITYGTNSLISTQSSYFKWYLNNIIATGVSGSTYTNPGQGVYRVETSLDNYCWDASFDYVVVLNSAPILNDTVTVTIYPNPSIGTFNVVANFERVTNVITKITVADITGKVVYQSQKLLFFSNKIIIPVNLGTAKGTFAVNMDINGAVKSVIIIVN